MFVFIVDLVMHGAMPHFTMELTTSYPPMALAYSVHHLPPLLLLPSPTAPSFLPLEAAAQASSTPKVLLWVDSDHLVPDVQSHPPALAFHPRR
jgi:hypothetical protein